MTPQEQPDSQAGDELDNLMRRLRPTHVHSVSDLLTDKQAKAAISDYAERLAAERAIAELKALKPLIRPYDGNDMVLDILNDRIATLTKGDV